MQIIDMIIKYKLEITWSDNTVEVDHRDFILPRSEFINSSCQKALTRCVLRAVKSLGEL